MFHWDSKDKSPCFQQQCRQALGNFIRSFLKVKPWWVCLTRPVFKEDTTCIYYLLGFKEDVGIEFMRAAGLVKVGHSRNPNAIVVIKDEWERFMVEQKLSDTMETVNQSYVDRDRLLFINFGDKKALNHCPRKQFDGRVMGQHYTGAYLAARQRRLHKDISEIILSLEWPKECKELYEKAEEEQEVEKESEDERIEEPSTKSEFILPQTCISEEKTPTLFKMFSGEQQVQTCILNSLFLELVDLLKSNKNAVNFYYANGKPGLTVIVPQVNTLPAFMEKARKLRWIESLLSHVACEGLEKDEAAEWLCYYIGRKHEASFTLASASLGYPLVQRMNEAVAQAMWADANINHTQQRILKRHLRQCFGKRIFIPENHISVEANFYSVPTFYGEYKHYKDGDKSQKAEKCAYWSRDASLVLKKELERLLDYTDLNVVTNKLSSLASSGCTVVAGADQGQGAWRSWIKISTMSGAEIRNKMSTEDDFDPKSCYIIAQVAHIVCKKDHHEILSGTVSDGLSSAYETMQVSSLVFVRELSGEKVKSYFIPRNAVDVNIENEQLTYNLQGTENAGFTIKYVHDERLEKGSSIILIIPHFDVYVTGDLSFYADVLGMPNSSSYWCPWCLLSRVEWQQSADNMGEKRTAQFLNDTYSAIQQDTAKRMQPNERKGVSCAMHYKSLTPDNFVPPLLHMKWGWSIRFGKTLKTGSMTK